MAKRISKADTLVFKALQKAVNEEKLNIYLINSKINIPGSPVYNPWECLLPTLVPVLLGLLMIWLVGILLGLAIMIGGIVLSSSFIKKKMEHILYDRAKLFFTKDVQSCNSLWEFGGVVLVKNDDKKQNCLSPEGNWKDFIVLNFSEFMTDKKVEEVPLEDADEKAA